MILDFFDSKEKSQQIFFTQNVIFKDLADEEKKD